MNEKCSLLSTGATKAKSWSCSEWLCFFKAIGIFPFHAETLVSMLTIPNKQTFTHIRKIQSLRTKTKYCLLTDVYENIKDSIATINHQSLKWIGRKRRNYWGYKMLWWMHRPMDWQQYELKDLYEQVKKNITLRWLL